MHTCLRKLSNWLKYNSSFIFFTTLILVIVSVISVRNYTPNTFLTGWDNLHPEFNFKLNIIRSFNTSWQEYQGFGVPGGMAHASDVTRQIILWILSFVLPIDILRYSWLFLMLFVGSLGIFVLLSKVLLKGESKFWVNFSGFIASVFYIFNLGTLQYFFLPYESFLSFYGFLPWLILTACLFMENGGKKLLFGFLVASILATSAFYVQTMFVVYLAILGLFCLESIVSLGKDGFKRSFLIALVVLVVNSFWLLPVAYSTISNSSSLTNSKINSLATPETQIQNVARGNFLDIVSLKGFWWDYYDLITPEKYEYLYIDWINYLDNPISEKIFVGLFSLIIAGLFLSVLFKKQYFRWSYFGILLVLICYFMLATVNQPFGQLFSYLFTKVSILSEIFRSVFTKWSIATAFIYSIGIGYFVYLLTRIKFKMFKVIAFITSAAILVSSIWLTKPFFEGKLISEKMRVDIPNEYFELFKFFDNQPNTGAVVYLPVHVFWGWYYTDWGYNGSGFLWYGTKQPIIARTFDVWSRYNETFYYQIYKSIYDNDPQKFKEIITKYNISYLLLDFSEINPGGGGKSLLYLDRVEGFTSNVNEFEKVFSMGHLVVYKFNRTNESFVKSVTSVDKLSNNSEYSSTDTAYEEYGEYIVSPDGIDFPFSNLQKGSNVEIAIKDDSVVFRNNNILNIENKRLETPNLEGSEEPFNELFDPSWVTYGDRYIEVKIPIRVLVEEEFDINRGYESAKNCDIKNKGNVYKEYVSTEGRNALLLKAENGGVSCDYVYFPTVDYDKSYVVNIEGKNKLGRGLKIYLYNVYSGRLDLEEILPFKQPYDLFANPVTEYSESFVLFSKPIDDQRGYTASFESRSFGKVSSEVQIDRLRFIEMPLSWLSKIKLVPAKYTVETNNLVIKDLQKSGTWLYKVKVVGSGVLELAQGYEQGWVTYPKYEHVKVNSWSNGWVIEGNTIEEKEIYIFFWPQLLEWGGFILLGITSVSLFIKTKRTHV